VHNVSYNNLVRGQKLRFDINLFQRVYGSLPTSVFDRVGVLRELLCVWYGYFSQALLSSDEMDFIVQFLCLQ